jgi:large subunit ribosomal protein L3e/syntaxin 6
MLLLLSYLSLFISELFSAFNVSLKVDELDKAISVAERDPAYYGLNEVEIGKRRNWTSTARNQVFYYRRIFVNAAANIND